MIELSLELEEYHPFNLDYCFQSGQIFGWKKLNEEWYGITRNKLLKIRQKNNKLFVCSKEDFKKEEVIRFLGLADNKEEIDRKIALNIFFRNAISRYFGVRILRQDPVETIVSYICAQNKNIPAIENMIFELSRRFGTKKEMDGMIFYSLPDIREIACLETKDLLRTGLGYRAKYLLEAARRLSKDGFIVRELTNSKYTDAWKKIVMGEMKLTGVGPKVADCILLYGFGKMEAFPIDVWICRAYTEALKGMLDNKEIQYFESKLCKGKKVDRGLYLKLANAAREVFGEYAGYSQLYIFMYGRDFFRYC